MSPDRILTTHVGSLVRPPELVDFLKKQQNHEPYDPPAYEDCLRRSVAEVVKGQAEVGIDIGLALDRLGDRPPQAVVVRCGIVRLVALLLL